MVSDMVKLFLGFLLLQILGNRSLQADVDGRIFKGRSAKEFHDKNAEYSYAGAAPTLAYLSLKDSDTCVRKGLNK
jgi:hypothetical protein